jgi:hypothetical protein
MKYIPFAVVLVALIPSPAYAQNTQSSDCRTLEAAGNNIESDEVLVDGMVCKAVKAKANPSVSKTASGKTAETEKRMALLGIIEPETLRSKAKADAIPPEVVRTPASASGKTAETEKRMALLGIIEPETLRSKPTAEANPAGDVTTPRTGTEPEPETEPGANVTPQSAQFEMKHNASLGDIARAYQKNSQAQAAAARENIVAPKKLPTEEKLTATPTATAPEMATTAPLQPGHKANALTVAQAPTSELTPKESPPTITPASVTPTGPQTAAKTEVLAAPQTPVPAVKVESNLPTDVAAPVATPEPPSDGKMEVFVSAAAAPSPVKPEASPVAAPAPEEIAASAPQKSVMLGVFVEPHTSSSEITRSPEVVSYGSALEDGFNDGQRAGCTKNVSLGSLDKEKLFLAIPEWAASWYEKNQKKFPGMCFSDAPMPGAQNYLIVFYTSAPAVSGTEPLKNISASADMSPASGVGTFTTSYGSTWHYTYDRTATPTVTTVLTEKVPHNLQPNVLYATAYSEQGIPISQHWPTAITKRPKETSGKHGKNRDASLPAIHMMGELLNEMAEDIAKH